METNFFYLLGVLSIIGSVIAAYLSFEIYRYNRLSPAWLAVAVAFILIIFRRAIGMFAELGYFVAMRDVLKYFENVLLLVISILYIIGFWSMKQKFAKFDLLEKKVRKKVDGLSEDE